MPTVLKDKNVIIRKPRQCFSCYRKFEIGSKMNYCACIYEGDFCDTYSCLTCREIFDHCDDTEYPEGFVAGWLNKGQTPEQLLEELKKEKQNK